MTRHVPRRAMTAGEVRMAIALGGCSFIPGTFDKRWAREISAAAESEQLISEKEAALLRIKVVRYRRQIPREIVALAGEEVDAKAEYIDRRAAELCPPLDQMVLL